jgi:hypothetical protein
MPKRKHCEIKGTGQTVTVKLSEVPAYLQNGELFKSMQSEAHATEDESSHDAEEIEVPANCIKPDQSVRSVNDIWSLMHSLGYWIVNTALPSSLVAFSLSPSGKELPASFWSEFTPSEPGNCDANGRQSRTRSWCESEHGHRNR